MNCQKCGTQNPDDARFCGMCGLEFASANAMPTAQASASNNNSKTMCGLATASLITGICGFITCGIGGLVSIVLGILAIMKINKSQGALSGKGVALTGAIVGVVSMGLYSIVAPAVFQSLSNDQVSDHIFPFQTARMKARQSSCASNLKQIGLAIAQYRTDYNERMVCQPLEMTLINLDKYPKWSYPTQADMLRNIPAQPANQTWMLNILPYINNPSIFVCPTSNYYKMIVKNNNSFNASTYAYNGYFNNMMDPKAATGRPTPAKGAVQPIKDIDVNRVSALVIIHELAHLQYGSVISPFVVSAHPAKKPSDYTFCAAIFGKGIGNCENPNMSLIVENHNKNTAMNYLFYDGHVEMLSGRIGVNDKKEFEKYFNPWK